MALGKKMIRIARVAASASPQEWITRGRQVVFGARNYIASARERSALSTRGHLRSLRMRSDDVVPWWDQRKHRWFIDDQRIETLQASVDQPDSQIPWVLHQADLVLAGEMPLFSYDPIEFQGPDRWHRDAILGKTASRRFHGLVKYLDVDAVGDSKHVWEPNRFSWVFWLGVAHLITGDEKYAEAFFGLVEDWFEQNPYPMGVNYCSSLELAFRNYAWVWALHFFSDRIVDRPDLLEKMLQGIWTACRHIESNLSTYFAPNTHITGEGFGLFVCGAAFPEFREASRWRKLGSSILVNEAKRQFYKDGTHRELSSCYHLYSTDFYLQAMSVGIATGFPVPTSVAEAAKRMAVRLSQLSTLDRNLPPFNDCDGGRLTTLVSSSLDAGPTLMAAEALFDDVSLVMVDQHTRGYPLLMTSGSRAVDKPRRRRIQLPFDRDLSSIYDSGIATYKTWNGDYLLFRASSFGYDECPHSHDAALGIIVYLMGVPVFVDNGVGSYTQSKAIRNQFRSASGKNTPLVGGRGPSIPEGWFSWARKTDCQLVSMRRFSDGFSARGRHSGYSERLGGSVFLQREVTMLDEGIVTIVDQWDADHEIEVEAKFTLNPALELDVARHLLQCDGQTIHFTATNLNPNEEDLEFVRTKQPFSSNYGQISDTDSISFQARPSRRGGIATILSRAGRIQQLPNRGLRFEDDDSGIHLLVTEGGIEPTRTDSKQTTLVD